MIMLRKIQDQPRKKLNPKPLNLKLQKIATRSLRNGLVAYDRRKGWRGPLKNIKYSENWSKKIEKDLKLEKSIGWQIAIIKKINQFDIIIETENKLIGIKDFSCFRSANCQSNSPIRKINDIIIARKNDYLYIDIN